MRSSLAGKTPLVDGTGSRNLGTTLVADTQDDEFLNKSMTCGRGHEAEKAVVTISFAKLTFSVNSRGRKLSASNHQFHWVECI